MAWKPNHMLRCIPRVWAMVNKLKFPNFLETSIAHKHYLLDEGERASS